MKLGIVEGYFGSPWSWEARTLVMRYLAEYDYAHYTYAPKADLFLRRDWMKLYSKDGIEQLKDFSAACERSDVAFGIGLSPYEIYKSFDGVAKCALRDKIVQLEDVGLSELAIFFDDMSGDLPDLAERQVEIMTFVECVAPYLQLSFCPSYYSDDAVLDRVFGTRPPAYLESIGQLLNPDVDVFWTGEEVCSREISPSHLERISSQLRRKPILWDNYPVNDGPTKAQYLNVRGFTGRTSKLTDHVRRHVINPSLQPHLSLIPALTLAQMYRFRDHYCYIEATRDAAIRVLGKELAFEVLNNLIALNDTGLDRLGERVTGLVNVFNVFEHAAAKEILLWLRGHWNMSGSDMEIE
jgi:hyaluronoglucosaminidase